MFRKLNEDIFHKYQVCFLSQETDTYWKGQTISLDGLQSLLVVM